MPPDSEKQSPKGNRTFQGKPLVQFHGFLVMQEVVTRSRKQLAAIRRLTRIEKQFLGTMVDTEVAVGYFIRRSNVMGNTWVAYLAVKMKYPGNLVHMAKLVGHLPPSKSWNANIITKGPDLRWSLNLQGIVAFTLLGEIRPYIHNEKSAIEVDCILRHGPALSANQRHPFEDCGAIRIRRGVWFWPQIDDKESHRSYVHSG